LFDLVATASFEWWLGGNFHLFICVDNVCSEPRAQDADVSDSAELAALVASMNTVCRANPVLIGQ